MPYGCRIEPKLQTASLKGRWRLTSGAVQSTQPGQIEAVEHDGNWYIVMLNVKGVLAVYRNREVKGESVLKCLKRWPKEVTKAFVRTTNLNLLIDDRQNRDS